MKTIADPRAVMLESLAASGLDEDDAKKLKITTHINGKAIELTGFDNPCYKIPYFDIGGHVTDFWRARWLVTRNKNKYFQLKGSPVRVYFPPYVDWEARAKDVTKPIFVTEGEKKSACACKNGIATIGLGGVWSFGSKSKAQDLIPDLEQITWAGRTVYICYDSDAAANTSILSAENEFAKRLVARSAHVYIVRLPEITKDKKTGLDDFLVHKQGGVKRFERLVEKAEEWAKSAALRKFNEEVLLVRDPGFILVRATEQKMNRQDFIGLHYADRKYRKASPTEKDPARVVEASVPEDWLEWQGRSTVARITYAPGKPQITDQNEYNMWRGWGAEPIRGSIAPWNKLLDYIFKDMHSDHRKWFEQWCAYPIQHPGVKLNTDVVMWSVAQGTGKTLLGYTLGRIYGTNYTEISDEDLDEAFNDWAMHKQFVLGDEITGSSGREKRQLGNKLKGMVTRQVLKIKQKYLATYSIPDCINYMFTSNHSDVISLENTDRRHFVVEIKGEPMAAAWYSGVYDPWYKSKKGIDALMWHMKHVDLAGFNPMAPAPMTEAKQAMMADSMSEMAAWLHDFWHSDIKGKHVLMSASELLLRAHSPFGWTVNGLSRTLRSEGFCQPLKLTQLRLNDGRCVRPWVMDPDFELPKTRNQKTILNVWEMDRQPEAEPKWKQSEFLPTHDEHGNLIPMAKRHKIEKELGSDEAIRKMRRMLGERK